MQLRSHENPVKFSAWRIPTTTSSLLKLPFVRIFTGKVLGNSAQVYSQLKHLKHLLPDQTALRCNALPLTSSDLIHMSFSQPPLRSTFSYGFVRWLFGTRPSATCFVVCLRPRMRAAPLCTNGYQSNQSTHRSVIS